MMPYKPKYCCQCGEKIDRIDWKPWTSRRFCELCEIDFGVYDKLRGLLIAVGLLFGLYGIGSYFQKPDKPLLTVAQQQTIAANRKTELIQTKTDAPVSTGNSVQTPPQTNDFNAPIKTRNAVAAPASNLTIKQTAAQTIESAERVYFCGAPTRKGTMCSRRMKNGGRCWQHAGQAALMPQEKLLAVQ